MVMLEGPLTSGSMKQTGIATEHANKFSNLNKSHTIYHYSLYIASDDPFDSFPP